MKAQDQVYQALKSECQKRDFNSLIQKDIKDLNIKLDEDQHKDYSKNNWNILAKHVIKRCAFQHLSNPVDGTNRVKIKGIEYLIS